MSEMKSAFITGAASGIGRATACLFAEKGWFVGLFDANEQLLRSLEAEIGTERCCSRLMDVTDPADVRRAVAFFSEMAGGRMDVLFNCAGILNMGHHHRIPLEAHQRIVDVNFSGILNCIHASMDLLRTRPGSRIINMSSASAVYGTPELAVYSATKCAVRGLTEALNIEFEPLGIIVCDVMAPYVRTPMITDSAVKASSVDRLGIRLQPEDVARVVWKAAHGKKVHWRVGLLLTGVMLLSWAAPFGKRSVMKLLAFSGKQEAYLEKHPHYRRGRISRKENHGNTEPG